LLIVVPAVFVAGVLVEIAIERRSGRGVAV
jgi:hypothetical protein